MGRTFLANILIGSKSKRILEQNLQELCHYGILKGYTAEEARTIIDQMIAKGYLITKQGTSSYPRPQLYLTALAEKALKEQIPIELQLPVKKAEICETGNLSVLEALKEWRKRIAAENSIPAYCVFHDSTLIGIANRLPKTTQELQTIKGIGERKIETYGNEILKIVDEVE